MPDRIVDLNPRGVTLAVIPHFIEALRPHQWIKNLLVFVPILMAHHLNDGHGLRKVFLVGIAFCLLASAGYVVNDLLDTRFDRQHPVKRNRVFASSLLRPAVGWTAAPLLYVAGIAVAWTDGRHVTVFCAIYMVLSLLYSVVLKRKAVIDVLVLAGLYMIRILAGGAAADVEVSTWLLGLAMFLFLSLALLKRYVDLDTAAAAGSGAAFGRGYLVEERELLRGIGLPSGLLAVLVLALYLTSDQVTRLYRTPRLLWLTCPLLLFWIVRMWLLAGRGEIDDDPIVAAVRDPSSYLIGALIALIAFMAV